MSIRWRQDDSWKTETRTCEWCKTKTFTPKSNAQICCSSPCEKAYRLHELSLIAYAIHAKLSLENEKSLTFKGHNIESNRGRIEKAMKTLIENNVIKVHSKKTESTQVYDSYSGTYKTKQEEVIKYVIVDMEGARKFEKKPSIPELNYEEYLQSVYSSDDSDDLSKIGYKRIDQFSNEEKIYIFFHPDEFDIQVDKIENDKQEGNKYYYLKENLDLLHKMVLKALVEIELKFNFPRYVQHVCEADKVAVFMEEKLKFKFHKYAISSVFDSTIKRDSDTQKYQKGHAWSDAMFFDEIVEEYTDNYNAVMLMNNFMQKTLNKMNSAGGPEAFIRLIRKLIIEDMAENHRRYLDFLANKESDKSLPINKLYHIYPFIEKHLNLFNYDSLYSDLALRGEEVINWEIHQEWNAPDLMDPLDLKGEFDEPADKGNVVEEQAA